MEGRMGKGSPFRLLVVYLIFFLLLMFTSSCREKPLRLKRDLILDFLGAERIIEGVSLYDGARLSGRIALPIFQGETVFGVKGSSFGQTVLLTSFEKGGSWLHLRIRLEGKEPAEGEIKINDFQLIRLGLNPGTSWYHLPLPEGVAERGELRLELSNPYHPSFIEMAYLTKGDEVIPENELSELFEIKKALIGERRREGFVLRPGRGVGFFLKPDEGDVLRFYLRGDSARLSVIVHTENRDKVLKTVSARRGKVKRIEIPLSSLRGEVIELIFKAEGSKGKGSIEVISPRIMAPKKRGERGVDLTELRKAANPPPNLIIILLDAARADHFSCYGYHRKTTPTIDRLASEGVIFEHAFSQGAYTIISLPTIMASLYPTTHKIRGQNDRLPEEMVTLAEVLSKNGFITGCFSDSPVISLAHGYGQGFDHFVELFRLRGNPIDPTATPWFVGKVINWVRSLPSGKPFFAFLHIMKPHEPYISPPFFMGMFDKNCWRKPQGDVITLSKIDKEELPITKEDLDHIVALYDGGLAYADHQVGRLISNLKRAKLYENTIFIIIADHGEAFREHGRMLHTTTVYDEMIHIPLIIRFPRRFPVKRRRVDSLAQLIDLAPTICELYGIDPRKLPFEGKSLLPAIFGKEEEGDPYIYSMAMLGRLTVRGGRYKYIYDGKKGMHLLFDLKGDPGERRNIIFGHPLLRKYLYSLLLSWYEETSAKKTGEIKKIKLDKETEERLRALGYIE